MDAPTSPSSANRQTSARSSSSALELVQGIDPRIQTRGADGTAVVVARRTTVPDPSEWGRSFSAAGIERLAYVGDNTWILRVQAGDLDGARRAFGTDGLTALVPDWKILPPLRERMGQSQQQHQVRVSFFDDADPEMISSVLGMASEVIHDGARDYRMWLDTAAIHVVSEIRDVHFIDVDMEGLPLMSDARDKIHLEHDVDIGVVPPAYASLSGDGIRISTNESFDQANEDFWNHDAAGTPTTGRWEPGVGGGGPHGTMTAGIIMGNGWNSASNGGAPFQYRGIAPEAIYVHGYADPDVENHSYTQSNAYGGSAASSDDRMHDPTHIDYHPHVGSAGNEGYAGQYSPYHHGYYSLWRVSKNETIVQNMSSNTLSLNGGSQGPTWDGRIKPDIAAPGHGTAMPVDATTIDIDVDYIEVDAATGLQRWDFNTTSPGWTENWGTPGDWWTFNNMAPPTPLGTYGRWTVTYPWGSAWASRPRMGAQLDNSGAPLAIVPSAGDTFTIRYRMAETHWDGSAFNLTWNDNVDYGMEGGLSEPIVADGAWHTATFAVGAEADWTSLSQVRLLGLRFGGVAMKVPAHGSQGYGGAGGTSASGPVVAGVYTLMTESLRDQFGIDLLDNTDTSPFWVGPGGPSDGVALPSTFKAIALHTAQDLAAVHVATEQPSPDTLAPVVYHPGPDYVTGYGLIDAGASLGMLDAEAQARVVNPTAGYHHIVEDELTTAVGKIYTFEVPPGQRRTAVTIAWDDAPMSPVGDPTTPKLVNDLDLLVQSPSGTWHKPWSLDLPYVPTAATAPGLPAPEPITAADLVPARHDIANKRDNVEKVEVPFPEAGTWTVAVVAASMADPDQRFSMVMGVPEVEHDTLDDGMVTFVSDRVSPPQVFRKEVGSAAPPVQITSDPFGVRHLTWSWNGEYLAYVTWSRPFQDQLVIVDIMGNEHARYSALPTFGMKWLGYPAWSRQGDRISVMKHDSWSARGLDVLDFSSPYEVDSGAAFNLIPPGVGAADLDAGTSAFSPDGRHLYFGASNNAFTGSPHRIRLDGTGLTRLMADGSNLHQSYHLSLSPDGRYAMFNSDYSYDDPSSIIDGEIIELDMQGGVVRQQTSEPGSQIGLYALHGDGEWILANPTSPSGRPQIELVHEDERKTLDIADPTNAFSDYSANWYKGELELVRLRHADSGTCLYNTPSDVHVWGCWNDPGMVYALDDAGGGTVLLRNLATAGCVQVGPADGAVATNAPCDAALPTQRFDLVPSGGGEVRLRSDLGKCLYSLGVDGSNAHSWGCWADPAMDWIVESAL